MGEFTQYEKHNTQLPNKFHCDNGGPAAGWFVVMASNVYLSPASEMINLASSEYVCIGHVYNGPGVATDAQPCQIELPLTTDPLCNFTENLRVSMCHNFMPTVMTMASIIHALHYQTMLQKLRCCPVALAFGNAGTGKTIALQCGLSLMGVQDTRFYSKFSKEKVFDLCFTSSIPLGVDDPQSKADISRLIIDLYNDTIGRRERKPISTCVITSNFTTLEQQR